MLQALVQAIALNVLRDLVVPVLDERCIEHTADHACAARLHERDLLVAHAVRGNVGEIDFGNHGPAGCTLCFDRGCLADHLCLHLGEHLAVIRQRRLQFAFGCADGGRQIVDAQGRRHGRHGRLLHESRWDVCDEHRRGAVWPVIRSGQ
jgi:hypothetical protein